MLKRHFFICKKQSEHYNNLKENIIENEAAWSFNFAENYAFILQDKAQSFNTNKGQTTIFPITVYLINDSNGFKFKSIIFISECNKHDS